MKSFQSRLKDKPEVDTILVANCYLLKCKLSDDNKSDLARKYLTSLIAKALKERTENKIVVS